MGKNRLLIVFTGVIIRLLLASCTYDYFKDETNYQVYVPKWWIIRLVTVVYWFMTRPECWWERVTRLPRGKIPV